MRRLAGLLLCLTLGACTSGSYNLADLAPTSTSSAAAHRVLVSYPRYGDNDPHLWRHTAPHTHPVHGTDVSKYQGSVDWEKARASGISFAFIKATEGGDRLDDHFHENWRATKAAGIPRSAYHFFYFCRPAREQAAWFIRHVPRDPSALPHVLDMEWNHLSPTCSLRPPADEVQREMRVFLNMIERHYGKRPIIYTSIDFYEDNRLHQFDGYDWWLRSVSAHPSDRYGDERFLFWQYTGTGIVPGIEGDADINVFNGSEREWVEWLEKHTG